MKSKEKFAVAQMFLKLMHNFVSFSIKYLKTFYIDEFQKVLHQN